MLKTVVFKFWSVKSVIIPVTRTGKKRSKRTDVIRTDQMKN